jgi:hypothetical protein
VRSGSEDGAAAIAAQKGRTMIEDFPRELATKIDRMLARIAAGTIAPDPVGLLEAAITLEKHGELVRADRCRKIAARLLPNLQHGGRVP